MTLGYFLKHLILTFFLSGNRKGLWGVELRPLVHRPLPALDSGQVFADIIPFRTLTGSDFFPPSLWS